MDLSNLSLNQITTERWTVEQAVEGCVRAGIPYIGFWRHKVKETGLSRTVKLVKDAGLKVSGLCRGGMFAAPSEAERVARIDDNRRAIDEAAALGTDVVVLVCGPPNGCTLDDARKMVVDGIAKLLPYAAERQVKLGIEPLHPVFAADRSVVVSLGQANDMVVQLNSPNVGVVVDVYHVWWDPCVYQEIRRARGHIVGFHVNDWTAPVMDALHSRAMMGDGYIEIRRLREAVEAVGYHGPVEVEILNHDIWNSPYPELLEHMKQRFQEVV